MKGFKFWLQTREPIKNKIKKPEDIHEGDMYVDCQYKVYDKKWGLTIMKNPAINAFQVMGVADGNKYKCVIFHYRKNKGLVKTIKANMTKKQIFKVITGTLIKK